VIELRSSSDSLTDLRAKMQEYMGNGARLGWLIDPLADPKLVYIYRPQTDVEILDDPETVSAEPELRGFTLNLNRIWNIPP
jgi:Uma2 family endonuclease